MAKPRTRNICIACLFEAWRGRKYLGRMMPNLTNCQVCGPASGRRRGARTIPIFASPASSTLSATESVQGRSGGLLRLHDRSRSSCNGSFRSFLRGSGYLASLHGVPMTKVKKSSYTAERYGSAARWGPCSFSPTCIGGLPRSDTVSCRGTEVLSKPISLIRIFRTPSLRWRLG